MFRDSLYVRGRGLSDFRGFYNFPRLFGQFSAIFAQIDTEAHYFLSFMTMEGRKVGAGMPIQPAQQRTKSLKGNPESI
jgi:hypothetical protein